MKDQAEIVIIGGGIYGVNIAYHLAKLGWTDVVLLEKHDIASGESAQAAGLVTQFATSETLMKFRKYSIELYSELGLFDHVGSLRVASSLEQLKELQRSVSRAKGIGMDVEIISPAEALRIWAQLSPKDLCIKGSMGGTALRQTLSSLIAPTSNQRTMIKDLGLEIKTATGEFVGFTDIVRQLEEVFRTRITDPAKQAGIAMKLFGDRAGPGMLAVIKEGSAGLMALTSELKSGKTAAETATERMDNLTDSITKLKRAGERAATTALYSSLGVFKELVDFGTESF